MYWPKMADYSSPFNSNVSSPFAPPSALTTIARIINKPQDVVNEFKMVIVPPDFYFNGCG